MLTRFLCSLLLVAACAVPISLHPLSVRAAVSPTLPLCGASFSPGSGGFPRVLRLGTRPQHAEVSERTGHAFIPLSGTNGIGGTLSCRSSVTTIDSSGGRFVRSVAIGAAAPSLAVDNVDGRVFVVGYRESRPVSSTTLTLAVLDRQGRVMRMLPSLSPCPCAGNAMGPLQVGVDTRHGRFFVFTDQSVLVFDARTVALLKTVPVDSAGAGGASSYAVDSRDGRVFVSTLQGVTVLKSTTGAIVQRIDLGASERSIALDEQTGRLFVGSAGGCRGGGPPGNVTVLDSATGKVVRAVLSSCTGFLSMLVDAPVRRVLVRIWQSSPSIRYAVLDALDGRLLRFVTLPSPLNYTAVDAHTGRIYNGAQICSDGFAGCARLVQVLDPNGWRIVKTLGISGGYQGFLTTAGNARRLLVVSPYAGTLTVTPTV